ncbi:MAG: hypothetical protein WAL63_13040, partial [Solirubrobacteraceae bacterium]
PWASLRTSAGTDTSVRRPSAGSDRVLAHPRSTLPAVDSPRRQQTIITGREERTLRAAQA